MAVYTATSAKLDHAEQMQEENDIPTDFIDAFTQLEEEPEKSNGVIRRLGREMLQDTLHHARRKIESFHNDCNEEVYREIEVMASHYQNLIQ